MSRGLNNPKAFSTQDEAENPTITAPQITDASDFPHTGLIKALSLGMRGNYATTGFNATSVTDVAVTFANGVVFRDGEEVGVTGGTITIGSTTGTTTAYTTGYHLIVNETGTTTLTVRPPTGVDAVPEYDDDDVIIAILGYTGNTPMQIQYLTINKSKNSLSVARSASGTYTEMGTITADTNSLDIVTTNSNADINLSPHGTGNVGIGTNSPVSKVEINGDNANDVALTVTNSQESSDSETATLRLKSTRGTDSDFEIVHDAFGNTEFFSNQPDTDSDKFVQFSATPKIVLNPDAIDMDTQIAGDTDSNLFYVDAGNDRIGIGTDSPAVKLHITSGGSGEPKITIENTNDDSQEAQLEFKKNGTSPANSDDLGIIRFVGDDSNGSAHLYSYIMADSETVTAGAENGRIFFFNSKAGTTREVIGISHDEIVINEAGVDTNFRVEGDGDANLLFVDAGNDRVGIGTNSPSTVLEVSGEITASDVTATAAVTGDTVTANTALTTNGLLFRRPEVLDNNAPTPHIGPISGTVSVIYINDITATTPPAPPNPSPNAVQLPDPATVANTIFTLSNIGGATVAITVATGEPINDNSTAHRLITTANQIDLPAGDAITVQAITDQIAPLVNGYYTISS